MRESIDRTPRGDAREGTPRGDARGAPPPPYQQDAATRELVEAARRGDELAWEEIHQRYYAFLRIFLHGRIPDRVRARFETADVIQSGFVRAYERIALFQPKDAGSFRAWLQTLMVNKLRDELRHHDAEQRSADREGPAVAPGLRPPTEHVLESPSVGAEKAERIALMLEALHDLEPGDQRLILLRVLDDLTWVQIASRLEIGETTARTRYAEALERLVKAHR